MTISEKLKVVRMLLEECEAEAAEHESKVMRIHDKTMIRVQVNTIRILANHVLYKSFPECFEENNKKPETSPVVNRLNKIRDDIREYQKTRAKTKTDIHHLGDILANLQGTINLANSNEGGLK